MIWGIITSILIFTVFLFYIYRRCRRPFQQYYQDIPPPTILTPPSSTSSTLFTSLTPSPSPLVPPPPASPTVSSTGPSIALVTYEDEMDDGPVSSRTRRHTKCSKKLKFTEYHCYLVL